MKMSFRISMMVVAAVSIAACNKADTPPDANAAPAGGARGGTKTAGQGGAGGGSGRAGGAGGGRGPTTLTLAASDISVLQPTTIEDVASISGDLHPIETVVV